MKRNIMVADTASDAVRPEPVNPSTNTASVAPMPPGVGVISLTSIEPMNIVVHVIKPKWPPIA